MGLLDPGAWAVWVACLLMAVSVHINLETMLVPNSLTLRSLAVGLVVSLLVTLPLGIPSRGGGIGSSLAGMVLTFVLLVALYRKKWLQAGGIKMQMAFAVWIGCALSPPNSLVVAVLAFLMSAAIYVVMFLVKRRQPYIPLPAGSRDIASQPVLAGGSYLGLVAAALFGWV